MRATRAAAPAPYPAALRSVCGELLAGQLDALQRAFPDKPRNRGLYECIRNSILDGLLTPSSRLPSTRDLARELGLSRTTVTHAFDQLTAEGYLRARTGSGSFVCDEVPDGAILGDAAGLPAAEDARPSAVLSQRGRTLVREARAGAVQWGAFMPGIPDVTEFPHRRFLGIYQRIARQPAPQLLSYGVAGASSALGEAICAHLRQTRAVQCSPEQILVTEGVHHTVDLIVRLLADVGDQAWVEEPGYWGLKGLLGINGVQVVPQPVDVQGMQIGRALLPPRLAFVTPSHQYPLGAVMSLSRRTALLEFAVRHNTWIVEDDYDGEFRFEGHAISSLQGVMPGAPVLYIGTFSKTLYPGLRVAYVVVPRALVAAFRTAHAELYRDGHGLVHAALAEFLREGHHAAHIRRMRLLYGARRAFLLRLIDFWLGRDWLHEYDSPAGLHVLLKFPPGLGDLAVEARARQQDLHVRALSRYYADPQQARQGLLIGFAAMPEQQMGPAFERLVDCIRAEQAGYARTR